MHTNQCMLTSPCYTHTHTHSHTHSYIFCTHSGSVNLFGLEKHTEQRLTHTHTHTWCLLAQEEISHGVSSHLGSAWPWRPAPTPAPAPALLSVSLSAPSLPLTPPAKGTTGIALRQPLMVISYLSQMLTVGHSSLACVYHLDEGCGDGVCFQSM